MLKNINRKEVIKGMNEFEKAVRHALIDKGWKLSRLADELEITVSYLFEILKGTRKAEAQKKRICEILGIEGDVIEKSEQLDSQ